MAPRYATTLIAALVLALLSSALPAPALAQPNTKPGDIQAQIDAHLKAFPGGVQTGPYEITYDNGEFVMTFARTGFSPSGTADCPHGWFCFYDSINFGYPRGKLSDCGWQDLARWGWANRTESAHYNLDYGSVAFIRHATGETYHDFDVAVFGMGSIQQTLSDVWPYRNETDHVQRYC